MKSLQQIKKELHEYIDGISDEIELKVIYEQILKYLKNESDKVETSENYSLPDNQEEEIDETMKHKITEEIKREKEFKKSMSRWFNDGRKNP